MEHRCIPRVASSLDVIILKQGLPVGRGQIKNGNRWGIYVESNYLQIEPEHQLSLELVHSKIEIMDHASIKIEALVIYTTEQGFGLEIDIDSEMQANLFSQLLKTSECDPDWLEPRFKMIVNG